MKLKRGQTALITGASSGLGAEFARQLAAGGVNLVLVARSRDRLNAMAEEVRSKDVKVSVVPADLCDPTNVTAVADEVLRRQSLSIDLLVNNAGLGDYGLFESQDPQRIQAQLSVNIAALVSLTRAFLAPMLDRTSGAVLNVASTAGFQPVPRMAVYAATKAFVLSFSEALAYECRGRGVHVLALCPGPVATQFAAVAGLEGSALFERAATPQSVVKTGLRALEARRTVKINAIGHFLLTQATRFAPRRQVVNIAGAMMRPHAAPGYTASMRRSTGSSASA